MNLVKKNQGSFFCLFKNAFECVQGAQQNSVFKLDGPTMSSKYTR